MTSLDQVNTASRNFLIPTSITCARAGPSQQLIFDFAKAITGFPITLHSWRSVNGPRIITLQKALLLMGEMWEPVKDDDNPPRFYEPLPSGPYKGQTTDKDRVEIRTLAYFETLGWDERGVPTKETLERLGLGDVEPYMAKYRQ